MKLFLPALAFGTLLAACGGGATPCPAAPPQTAAEARRGEIVCPADAPLDAVRGVCVRSQIEAEVACPDGATWTGMSCQGRVDQLCPSGTDFTPGEGCKAKAVAPPPPQAGTLGNPGERFTFGKWTIEKAQNGDAFFWYGSGKKPTAAVELIAMSNGWFHYAENGNEFIVWTIGTTDPQDFYVRPWTTEKQAMPAPERGTFTISKESYSTLIGVDGPKLTVRLHGGHLIEIESKSSKVKYDGKVLAPKAPAKTPKKK